MFLVVTLIFAKHLGHGFHEQRGQARCVPFSTLPLPFLYHFSPPSLPVSTHSLPFLFPFPALSLPFLYPFSTISLPLLCSTLCLPILCPCASNLLPALVTTKQIPGGWWQADPAGLRASCTCATWHLCESPNVALPASTT